ncbi:MAG: SPASM domain-containing protein, partial [Clostridia bacterium]|nr:SPASM domain-containing protein [Clostridia bacterium]
LYLGGCLSFADKASKSGVLTVLRLWNSDGDGGKNTETLLKIKEFFKNDEWVFGTRGARIRNKLHLEYGERFAWPDINASDMGEDVFCYGLSDHFGILSDGSVVPCCLDSDGVITLGNIFDGDIDEILSSPRAENIRRGFKNKKAREELCRKCGYARRFKI